MRGNRSMFLGLFALVAAVGMLGANGYFWWVAQTREIEATAKPAQIVDHPWPTGKNRESAAPSDQAPEWFSPYRVMPNEPTGESQPKGDAWRRYFPHQAEAVEIAQADSASDETTGTQTTPPQEHPAPLLFPNPTETPENPEPPEWLSRLIQKELPQASLEERRAWTQELNGFEAEVVVDILRMKKNMTGIASPLPGPLTEGTDKWSTPSQPEPPPGEGLVPPPIEDWDLEFPSVRDRLQPSLAALDQARDIVLNNLANLQTIGFKRSRVVLSPLPSHTAQELSNPDEPGHLPESLVSVSDGIELTATMLDPSQGPLKSTRQPFDVAIEGPGYFQICDGKDVYFTRCGLWTTNAEGHLCLASGSRPLPMEPLITIPANADSITIAEDGFVTATTIDNQQPSQLGQIPLARFRNASGLTSRGGHLLAASPASGPPQTGTPQSRGFGVLRQGMLELSNVLRDEELEQFEQIQSHWLLLKQLVRDSDENCFPGPVARRPISRTQRASAHSTVVPPPSLEPLKQLGKEGRNLIEEYLQSERMKTFKRTLGLK